MPFFDDKLEEFLEYLTRFGLEHYRRYYGPYKAKVINNKDPEGQGRIIAEIPRARVPKENASWILPAMHGAGKQHGLFWPPEEGDYVFANACGWELCVHLCGYRLMSLEGITQRSRDDVTIVTA